MRGYIIGEILREERKKKKIAQAKLARGLCSVQTLSAMENGESESDKLLMDIFLQRLGKSPDKLECILSVEEYNKIRARDILEELIQKGKGKKAEFLLDKYITYFKSTDRVHQMYYHRSKAYILLRTGILRKYSEQMEMVPPQYFYLLLEAEEQLGKAISDTVPDWHSGSWKEELLSTYEIENLLAYGKVLYMKKERDRAVTFLWDCFQYIVSNYSDDEERAKILPKCAWLLSVTDDRAEYDGKIRYACEEAFQLLREQSVIYFMRPLLQEILRRRGGAVDADTMKLRSFKNLLQSLYDAYLPNDWKNSLFHNNCQKEYYLDYEVIRSERVAQGLTQEQLIEEVYQSPETLSRVENGKVSPNRKKLDGLMKKLSVEKERYNSYIVTGSFSVMEKKHELDRYISRGMYQEAEKTLNELKAVLDLNYSDNARYCKRIEIILQFNKDRTIKEEAGVEAEALAADLLRQSYHNSEFADYRIPFREEAALLARIFEFTMANSQKRDYYLASLNQIISCYKKSRVNVKFHCVSYGLLMQFKGIILYERRQFDEGVHATSESIKFSLMCGWGNGISSVLVRCACSEMAKKQTEIGKIHMWQAYWISELLMSRQDCLTIEQWYENKYHEKIPNLN